MLKKMTLSIMIVFSGLAATQANEPSNTLRANGAVPESLIFGQLDDSSAETLLAAPYKGFYQVESQIRKRRITFGTVESTQSYPDARWSNLARDIAGLVEMPAYSTGSRIEPKATAFVAFYDLGMPGLDRSRVRHLPTSSNAEPNMLVVLIIKHQNHSRSRDVKGTRSGSSSDNGNEIYLFELAM
jgi:hypothetical protein